MIRANTARQLLYDWHGGQASPFYAAASSGLVADWPALMHECTVMTPTDRDKLKVYFRAQLYKAPTVTIDGVHYAALPWARKS